MYSSECIPAWSRIIFRTFVSLCILHVYVCTFSSTFNNHICAENTCRVSSLIWANDLWTLGVWIWFRPLSFSYSGITRYHLNGLAKALTQRVSAEATYRSLPLRLDLWATDPIVIDHWSSVSLLLGCQGTSSSVLEVGGGNPADSPYQPADTPR